MATGTLFDFGAATIPVRDDIPQAFRESWQHIGSPGSGWDGTHRVAIARECRAAWDCASCAERKAALSPSMVAGQHSESESLPAAAVDAVHRITTDPGRLTETWFKQGLADGLTRLNTRRSSVSSAP